MANIKNIEGLSVEEINDEISRGAKFVIYQYCISILIMTFKRPSDIYFVRSGESAVSKGIVYTVVTFFLGWWGIPWGPIYSIQSMVSNFGGGKDVTREVVNSINSNG